MSEITSIPSDSGQYITNPANPPGYQIRTTTEPAEKSDISWLWIVIIIILILVIVGLIIWLVFAARHNKADRVIQFTGANVEVVSDTQIRGTWPQTGSTQDLITLYATQEAPQFNSNGTLTNQNQVKAQTSGANTSVTLGNLQKDIKYFATLVVTNNGTSNYQFYTQIVFMNASTPPVGSDTTNVFEIADILQVGKIIISNDEAINFTQTFTATESANTEDWFINPCGQIESVESSDKCIYLPTGDTVLKAGDCGCTNNTVSGTTVTGANSKWSYNPGQYANRWCLTTTIDETDPTCMVLDAINSSSKTANVEGLTGTNQGDAWVNVTKGI